MPGRKTIVLDSKRTIGIVDRRTIERIAHHLPPMDPAGIEAMVVIVLSTSNVIVHARIVVVVDWAALVPRIQEFDHHGVQPSHLGQLQVCTQHDVFERIEQVTVLLARVPFRTRPIAIVIQEEHGRMILEVMVGIECKAPTVLDIV